MGILLKDILRDKGSRKYSITKVIAFVTFIFFIIYLGVYLFWIQKEIDSTLLIQLIGFMLTLLGFKNGWGIKKTNNVSKTTQEIQFESTNDKKIEEEGVF